MLFSFFYLLLLDSKLDSVQRQSNFESNDKWPISVTKKVSKAHRKCSGNEFFFNSKVGRTLKKFANIVRRF